MRQLPNRDRFYQRMTAIVQSVETVTLVGGGLASAEAISRCASLSERVIAADGGLEACRAAGRLPEAVIGDLDSVGDLADLPKTAIYQITEQDSTDFEKALRTIEAPLILGVGFTGGRLDHELACFNALATHPSRRCLLLGEKDIVFLLPPAFAIDLPRGTRASLFPIGAVSGRSTGLKWPIEGISFAPDGRIGTSNEITEALSLQVDAPAMLMILPEVHLEAVVTQLLKTDATWPARER